MSDTQKQIEEFIAGVDQMKPTIRIIFKDVAEWLTHQQSIIFQQAEEITEKDRTIAKIQREFEQTDWGKENIELRERFNYWRELAGTRDNKIRDQVEEIERLKKCMTDVRQIEVDEFGETIVSKMIDECLEENPHVNP